MFYCPKCQVTTGWPNTMSKSIGNCEVCGELAICNDHPARLLPDRKDKPK